MPPDQKKPTFKRDGVWKTTVNDANGSTHEFEHESLEFDQFDKAVAWASGMAETVFAYINDGGDNGGSPAWVSSLVWHYFPRNK